MSAHAPLLPLVILASLAISGCSAPLPQLEDHGAQAPAPQQDPVLFSKTQVQETAYLLRINNTNTFSVGIAVRFSTTEDHATQFFSQTVYHYMSETMNRAGRSFIAWGERSVLEIQVGGEHLVVGPSHGLYPFGQWFINYSYEFELSPGMQHVLVSMQGPPSELEVSVPVEYAGTVSAQLVLEDAQMLRIHFTLIDGHWNDIQLEVWTPVVGSVIAATDAHFEHSRRSLAVAAWGQLSETKVVDANGTSCDSHPRDLIANSWLLQPALGVAQIDARVTVGSFGPMAILMTEDVPLPPYLDSAWCFGPDDPPIGLLSPSLPAGPALPRR